MLLIPIYAMCSIISAGFIKYTFIIYFIMSCIPSVILFHDHLWSFTILYSQGLIHKLHLLYFRLVFMFTYIYCICGDCSEVHMRCFCFYLQLCFIYINCIFFSADCDDHIIILIAFSGLVVIFTYIFFIYRAGFDLISYIFLYFQGWLWFSHIFIVFSLLIVMVT